MSDTQKPVEETPVAAPAAPATETTVAAAEAPAATEAPAAEAPKETAAEATEAAPEAAPEETKADAPAEEAKEVVPASEGTLGYKAPGLVKSLRFSKRFFYFSDEAVEAKQLSAYRSNEKPAVANPIVAWASQTGKGLLFFTKRAEDKATPAGIISLADISDVTKEGSNEFLFKLNGHKHTFQASSTAERDSWIAALEAKSTEAKAEKDTITSSEGYKAELEKLSKPAAAPAKPAETKEEAKEGEDKKEEETPAAAPAVEESKDKDAKSRSRSRKRTSIFGTLLGKKEEVEEKKEEKKEEKEEAKVEEAKPAATAEAPVAEAPAAAEPAATEPPAAAAETADKKEEAKKEEKKDETEAAPAPKSKRSSLFGNFFQKVTSPSQEKTEKEAAAPAEPAPVASTAPQLDNPVEEAAKPIEPESVTAAPEVEAAKETPAESPAETPAAATKDKRRTSFFGSFGKKKADSGDEAAEGEAKPKNKLGGLFRKPSKAVKPETKEAAESAEAAEPKTEAVAEAGPAEETSKHADAPPTEETKPVVSTPAPVQAAA
ncbi:Pleckstrin homology domain-containing protein [Aspergillus fruticulosus]